MENEVGGRNWGWRWEWSQRLGSDWTCELVLGDTEEVDNRALGMGQSCKKHIRSWRYRCWEDKKGAKGKDTGEGRG
jgi:hypothetical protein